MKYFMLFGLFPFSAAANTATYQDFFNPKAAITVDKSSITLVDLERPLQRCKPTEAFVCVRSQPLTLAVPHDASLNAWVFEGGRYKVVSRSEGMILGALLKYQVIEVSGNVSFRFLYSTERGVISIKEPGGNMLMLQEACGMLARDDLDACSDKR